eukprot:g3428.t1
MPAKTKLRRITALDVTFGNAIATRARTKLHSSINRVASNPAFIWVDHGDRSPAFVVELCIVRGTEEKGTGWTTIRRDLAQGSKPETYIAYRTAPLSEADPITGIEILYDDDLPSRGFTKLPTSIAGENDNVYLAFTREVNEEEDRWSARECKIGDFLDVRDTVGNWCSAQVIQIFPDAQEIKVHFKGWSNKWDENISMSSARLARGGRHVTGSTAKKQSIGFSWGTVHTKEELDDRIKQVNDLIKGDLLESSVEWSIEMENFTQNCLLGHLPHGLETKVGEFLQCLVRLGVQRLKRISTPMPRRVLSALLLALGGDRGHIYFFENYGRMSSSARFGDILGVRQKSDGQFAEQDSAASSFLVENLNLFGRLGGFDALVERLLQKGKGNKCEGKMNSKNETEAKHSHSRRESREMLEAIGRGDLPHRPYENENSDLQESPQLATTLSGMIKAYPGVNGFDITTIDTRRDKVALDELCLIHAFRFGSDTFTTRFKRGYFPLFAHAVVSRSLDLTEEELRSLDESQLNATVRSLEELLSSTLKGDIADRVSEQFALSFAQRLMKSTQLANRNQGLDRILELIDMVQRKKRRDSFSAHGGAAAVHGYTSSYSSGYNNYDGSRVVGYGASNRMGGGNSGSRWDAPKRKARWLTASYLSRWILDHKVIETHVEGHESSLRRCDRILRFLAEENKIKDEQLKLLWGQVGHVPARTEAVYEIVESILDALTVPQMRALFAHVKGTPITAEACTMIRRFTRYGIAKEVEDQGHNGEREWYGLQLFWDTLQDKSLLEKQMKLNNGTSSSSTHCEEGKLDEENDEKKEKDVIDEELMRNALMSLARLLTEETCAPTMFPHYLRLICQNIKTGHSVPVSLSLLQEMLRSLQVNYEDVQADGGGDPLWEGGTAEQQLRILVEDEGIIELLVADLVRYKSIAREDLERRLQKRGEQMVNDDGKDKKIKRSVDESIWRELRLTKKGQGNLDSHENNISSRLRFIMYAISHCGSAVVDFKSAELVYQELWLNPLCSEEREAVAIWFSELLIRNRNYAASEIRKHSEVRYTCSSWASKATIEHVFSRLLLSTPADLFGIEGFRCFELFMRVVNGEAGVLANEDQSSAQLAANNSRNSETSNGSPLCKKGPPRLRGANKRCYEVNCAPEELLGYGKLWQIAICAPDATVAVEACDFISSLHLRLSSLLSIEEKRSAWTAFIARAMHEASNGQCGEVPGGVSGLRWGASGALVVGGEMDGVGGDDSQIVTRSRAGSSSSKIVAVTLSAQDGSLQGQGLGLVGGYGGKGLVVGYVHRGSIFEAAGVSTGMMLVELEGRDDVWALSSVDAAHVVQESDNRALEWAEDAKNAAVQEEIADLRKKEADGDFVEIDMQGEDGQTSSEKKKRGGIRGYFSRRKEKRRLKKERKRNAQRRETLEEGQRVLVFSGSNEDDRDSNSVEIKIPRAPNSIGGMKRLPSFHVGYVGADTCVERALYVLRVFLQSLSKPKMPTGGGVQKGGWKKDFDYKRDHHITVRFVPPKGLKRENAGILNSGNDGNDDGILIASADITQADTNLDDLGNGWNTVDAPYSEDAIPNGETELQYFLLKTTTIAELRDRIAADFGRLYGVWPSNGGSCIKLSANPVSSGYSASYSNSMRGAGLGTGGFTRSGVGYGSSSSSGVSKEITVQEYDQRSLGSLVGSPDAFSNLRATLLARPSRDTRQHEAVFLAMPPVPPEEREFGNRELSRSQSYFTQLFSLLSSKKEAVVALAWKLLMRIETNEKLMKDIQTLGGYIKSDSGEELKMDDLKENGSEVAWDDLLDPDNTLKLLYCLQIVEKIVLPSSERSNENRQDAKRWESVFVKAGGVNHLHSLLLSLDPTDLLSTPLGTTCAAALLKVTIHFSRIDFSDNSFVERWEEENEEEKGEDDIVNELESLKVTSIRRSASMSSNYSVDFDVDVVVRLLDILKAAASVSGDDKVKVTKTNVFSLTPRMRDRKETDENENGQIVPTATAVAVVPMDNVGSAIPIARTASSSTTSSAMMNAGGLATRPDVARYTINLLVAALLNKPVLLKTLFTYEAADEAILFPLLHSRQDAVRLEVARGLFRLCTQLRGVNPSSKPSLSSSPRKTISKGKSLDGFMLSLLLSDNAFGSLYEFYDTAHEYLMLLRRLLACCTSLTPEWPADKLLGRLARMISEHPVTEASADVNSQQDKLLQGLLGVTKALLSRAIFCDKELKRKAGQGILPEQMKVEKRIKAMRRKSIRKRGEGNFGNEERYGLIEEIFDVCLFRMPAAGVQLSPPKCKHPNTRKLAFEVLSELCGGKMEKEEKNRGEISTVVENGPVLENIYRLCQLARPHHDMPAITDLMKPAAGSPISSSNFEAASSMRSIWDRRVGNGELSSSSLRGRSSTGYVGLNNPCCICYMNSTNQQLFMLPYFRKGILAVQSEALKNIESRADDVLWQFQRLLAFLQESQMQAFRSEQLCASLKDFDGNPVNVTVQQDSTEYLTSIINRLENNVDAKAVIDDCFRIPMSRLKLADSIKFPGKTLRELGPQPGGGEIYLTVDVKGNDTLEEGLDQLFAGSEMEFRWFDGEKDKEERVKTTMKTFMNKMPRYLILMLKRFEADWSTVPPTMLKHNDTLRFSKELNMYKYSLEKYLKDNENENDDDPDIEQHPPEYYQYELSGIQIHRGAFNSGHYFSFIKTRDTYGTEKAAGKKPVWTEFNDSITRPFDPDRIPEDCFGGRSAQSAYVLVYDRLHSSKAAVNRKVNGSGDDTGPLSPSSDPKSFSTSPDSPNFERETALSNPMRSRGKANTLEANQKEDSVGDDDDATISSPFGLYSTAVAGGFAQKMMAVHEQNQAQVAMRGKVPRPIFEEITETNRCFWKDQMLRGKGYYTFISNLLVSASYERDEKCSAAATKLGMSFLLSIFADVDDETRESFLPDLMASLQRLYVNNEAASTWFLKWLLSDLKGTKTLLFNSVKDIRGTTYSLNRQGSKKFTNRSNAVRAALNDTITCLARKIEKFPSALVPPRSPAPKIFLSEVQVKKEFTVKVCGIGTTYEWGPRQNVEHSTDSISASQIITDRFSGNEKKIEGSWVGLYRGDAKPGDDPYLQLNSRGCSYEGIDSSEIAYVDGVATATVKFGDGWSPDEEGDWEVRFYTDGFVSNHRCPRSKRPENPAARITFKVPFKGNLKMDSNDEMRKRMEEEKKIAQERIDEYISKLNAKPLFFQVLESLWCLAHSSTSGVESPLFWSVLESVSRISKETRKYLLTLPVLDGKESNKGEEGLSGVTSSALLYLGDLCTRRTYQQIALGRAKSVLYVLNSCFDCMSKEDQIAMLDISVIGPFSKFILADTRLAAESEEKKITTVTRDLVMKLTQGENSNWFRFIENCTKRISLTFHNRIKGPFRLIQIALGSDESRIDRAMPLVVQVAQCEPKVLRFIESCAAQIMRLAKRNKIIATWLTTRKKGKEYLAFVSEICELYRLDKAISPMPPFRGDDQARYSDAVRVGKIRLFRQGAPFQRDAYGRVDDKRHNRNSCIAIAEKVRLLESGKAEEMEYDSDDDPESIIGRSLSTKWKSRRYECTLVSYDHRTRKHGALFPDGDRKEYAVGNDFRDERQHGGGDIYWVPPLSPESFNTPVPIPNERWKVQNQRLIEKSGNAEERS